MVLIISIVIALFLPAPWNIVAIVVGVFAEVGEVIWGRRLARRWRPKTGSGTMVGQTAEVVTQCRPSGQVRVNGEIWAARCAAGADVGAAVRIDAVDRLTLVVVPV
jgi:membrane protein implicated in regulation of membrane protease activity